MIIATTLARDYLPSSWSYYRPTWVEISIFTGTMGLFFTLYLIFIGNGSRTIQTENWAISSRPAIQKASPIFSLCSWSERLGFALSAA